MNVRFYIIMVYLCQLKCFQRLEEIWRTGRLRFLWPAKDKHPQYHTWLLSFILKVFTSIARNIRECLSEGRGPGHFARDIPGHWKKTSTKFRNQSTLPKCSWMVLFRWCCQTTAVTKPNQVFNCIISHQILTSMKIIQISCAYSGQSHRWTHPLNYHRKLGWYTRSAAPSKLEGICD